MRNFLVTSMLIFGLLIFRTGHTGVTEIQRGEGHSMFDVADDTWQPDGFRNAIVIPASFVSRG